MVSIRRSSPIPANVLIETAYFDPLSIRRTSKRLGFKTESSYRFERGTDPEGVLRALDRAAELMLEVGGGAVAAGRIDVYPEPIKAPEIVVRVDRANRFLGTGLSASEMKETLERIEMRVDAAGLESSPGGCAEFQERYYKRGRPVRRNGKAFRL